MKRVLLIALSATALVTVAQTEDEKIALASRLWQVMYSSPDVKEKSIEIGRVGVWSTPAIADRAKTALQYAKTNNIPLEVVLEAAKAQIQLSCAVLEANETTPSIDFAKMKCGWMLAVLLTAGDVSSLPFIEETSLGISNQWVRNDFINAYISFANTNAVPFLSRIKTDSRYMKSDFPSALVYFLQVLKKVPEVNDESFIFLYEIAEKDDNSYYIQHVDEALCEMLSGYSNSVQRLVAMRQHVDKSIPVTSPSAARLRNYFRNAKEEMEKIPEPQRKDFRAKGELLDPDRKKEP